MRRCYQSNIGFIFILLSVIGSTTLKYQRIVFKKTTHTQIINFANELKKKNMFITDN